MKAHRALLTLAALLLLTLPVFAQGVSSITGVIKDADGGVLPGVSVTIKHQGTGATRVVSSSGDGRFTVPGLVPGTYEITAKLQGFSDFTQKSVQILVGQTAAVNITLKPASVSKEITVTEETRPMIQTTESEVSSSISPELIQALPVAERNTITLALLTPGVSAAPYFDPTKSRDNFDGFQFGAGSASSTWTLVDGGDNNDGVVGSILQFYPQDSIQEFEVITSRFKAEYGHTDGGVINMITKSGTNSFAGGAYYYLRDDALNGKTFAEKDAGADKAEFHQDTLGAFLGGPIMQDKAFFFGNFDYTKRKKSLFTSSDKITFGNDGTSVPQDFKQTLAVGKLSANVGSTGLMARYAYQDDETVNVNLTAADSIEHGGLGTNKYHAFLTKASSVVGGDKFNEIFWQYNRFRNAIVANAVGSPLEFRELLVEESSLGHNINHPQTTDQDKHQFHDDFSFHASAMGDHDFKFGAEYIHVKIGGSFSTGAPFASFVYNNASTFNANGFPDSVTIFNGPLFFVGKSTNDLIAFYLQDDWKPVQNLTLNLGLRYDVELNDWNQRDRTFVSADPLFFGGQPDTDKNNFGPKLGFAYDVNGDGKLVVRGGYGLYYQQIFWNSPIRAQFLEGELSNAISVEGADVNFRPTDPFCGTPDAVGQPNCIPFPSVPAPEARAFVGSSGLTTVDPRMKTPSSHQFSFGASTQLPHGFALDADFLHTYSDSQIYRIRGARRSSINGLPGDNLGRRAPVNTQGHDLPAKLQYNALLLGLRNRYKNLTTQLSYTFGRGNGHVARQTNFVINDSDAGFDNNYGPVGPQRDHLFAGSVTYTLPYDFQLGFVAKFQSGYAFSGFDPTLADSDGDARRGDELADAGRGSPSGSGKRGEFRGDSFSQVDLRVSKKFTIAGRYKPQLMFEVFNLFNARNEKPDDVDFNLRTFDDAGNAVVNTNFGNSGGVAGQPFQAQVSVRFEF